MSRPAILVAGSINMDLVMYGLTGLPRWGESTFGRGHHFACGGKGANQAYAAARMGADCYMVGRIGRDENGESLMRSLESCQVNTSYVCRDDALATGFSTMNMGEDGRYFSIYSPGANDALSPADVDRALAARPFDLVMMQLEMPRETVFHLCEAGRRGRARIFLDAGPAMELPLEKLRGAYILSPNEAETLALTGIAPESEESVLQAAQLLMERACPSYVLLKLGGRGAFFYGQGQQRLIPARKVQAVDTTAAGDTFGAAFCVRLCEGAKIEEAVRYAHGAAAICVTRQGGQPSIPTREEADAAWQDDNVGTSV